MAKSDEKVRRWLLNSLARLGQEENCVPAIEHVLRNYGQEPQTMAAGIAALYKVCVRRSPDDVLRNLSFDPQMRILAALQHVPANKLDLTSLPLNVDIAGADLLRLALLVVGLDRSPVNLLNPRHTNAEMVRALGGHHDPIVSQYSVWAITENDRLGVAHLGVDLRDLAAKPTNVRAWVLQLLAMSPQDAAAHFEYLRQGMTDEEEARSGLALGLRDTYLDILEPLVLEWLVNEGEAEVRQHLLDHIIRQSGHSPGYAALALEFYEKEGPGSAARLRMEASAAGTHLYRRFRQIEFDGSGDLFRGMTAVTNTTNNNFNFQGGVQGNAVSLGGNATSSGNATIQHYTGEALQAIRTSLAEAERGVHESALEEGVKKEVLAQITAAKAEPTPGRLQTVIDTLSRVGAIAEAGTALAPYAESLAKAAGFM